MQQGNRPDAGQLNSSRVLLQFVGAIAACYLLVTEGGFRESAPTAVISAIGVAGALGAIVLSRTRWRSWHIMALAAMTIAGGLLVFRTEPAGWVLFAVGVFSLVGVPRIDLRTAGPIVLVAAIPVVAEALEGEPSVESVTFRLLAVAGIGIVGYSQRQARLRRQQERALVERSRQLEQRSRELIEQTERTQAETARAVALEERNRIARDIHDLLAHSLGGLVVQLDAADAVLSSGGDPSQVAERVRASRLLAVDGLREARTAVRELRDATETQEQLDVTETVRAITRGPMGLQLGLEYEVVGESRPVPVAVAQAFAAIAREALTNINKHAAGGRAVATMIFEPDVVRLEMINALAAEDDHERRELAGTGGSFGLAGMGQRFAEIGGKVTAGQEGGRWVLSAKWPMPDSGGVRIDG